MPFLKHDLYPLLPAARLLDPSFDNPLDHLEFVPAALTWTGKSKAGQFTVERLFAEKDYAERVAEHYSAVQKLVGNDASDPIFDVFIAVTGEPTVIRALIAYWRDLLRPMTPPPEPPG